jgi:hypothetical protein
MEQKFFASFFRKRRPFFGPSPGLTRPLVRLVSALAGALESLSKLQVVVVFAACLLLLLSFIPLQQNADGLILSIMSLQKPTVYYWEADRFGNLTALLTVWIRNPIVNEYAQILLQEVAGLVAPVFFCSLVFRRSSDAWRAAALSTCLLLVFGNLAVIHSVFVATTPYAISLTCAGLATLLLDYSSASISGTLRQWFGCVLLIVAYIVNFGLVIVALPLICLVALLLPSIHRMRLLTLHVVAASAGYLLPRILAPQSQTLLGLSWSPGNIAHYAAAIWGITGWNFILPVVVPLALVGFYLVQVHKFRTIRLFFRLKAAMLATAVLFFCVVASSHWLVLNQFDIRYFTPGYLLLMSISGLSIWLAGKLTLRCHATRGAVFVLVAMLLLLNAYVRLHKDKRDNGDIIDPAYSGLARAVAERYVAHALDGIAGAGISDGYWAVWPAVFMAEQLHYDLGYRGSNVIGIALRSAVRREDFAARLYAQGRLRLACIDFGPAECAARASTEMGITGLRFTQLAPSEQLPANHRLAFAEIMPPEVSK